jgi:hypothetical protein
MGRSSWNPQGGYYDFIPYNTSDSVPEVDAEVGEYSFGETGLERHPFFGIYNELTFPVVTKIIALIGDTDTDTHTDNAPHGHSHAVDVRAALDEANQKFDETYNCLTNNCSDFAEYLSKKLIGEQSDGNKVVVEEGAVQEQIKLLASYFGRLSERGPRQLLHNLFG